MAGFIEEIFAAPLRYDGCGELNYNSVSRRAIKEILPVIINQDLTERQRKCITLKFYECKTQSEIADELMLSQPTVSQHIKSAQEIIKNRICYCNAALAIAEKQFADSLN